MLIFRALVIIAVKLVKKIIRNEAFSQEQDEILQLANRVSLSRVPF